MKNHSVRYSFVSVVVALFSAALPAQADYSNTVGSLNPVAYYRLNETTPVPSWDVATNGGTWGSVAQGLYLSGATHPIDGIPGAGADTAATIPNTDHSWGTMRVRVPFNPVFNQAAAFTAEFWARPNQAGTIACPFASTDFNLATRYGWIFYQDNPVGQWFFRVYRAGAGNTAVNGGTVTAGAWQHVVGVYDGTSLSLYVNGTRVAGPTAVATAYTPVSNPIIPLTIGGRADGVAGTYGFGGDMDEVAYYTNALTGAEILAHYQAGTNSVTADYAAGVLAHNPPGYWRLNEPAYTPPDPSTLPYAANSGTLGLAARGTNYPGITTGVAGPPFSGLGANNYAYQLSGFAGNVGLGNPDGLNFTNQITFLAWIKPQLVDGLRNIISHGYVSAGSQELEIRINAGAYETGSWETGAGVASPAGMATADIGQWVLLAATYDGTTWKLYHNTVLVGSKAGGRWTAMPSADWSIGSRGDTSADQRYFAGTMDEPAIFNRALTQAEIQSVFWAGNVPPIIEQQPQAPVGTILAGAPVTLSVVAVGTPTLAYQWTKQGTNMPGQTTATLAFSNITTNDAGNYALVVTNAYGAVTSSIVALTVTYPTAPAALAGASGWPVYDSVTHGATLTQVILDFTGPLGPEGGNPAHYAIPGLTVSAAQFTNLNMTVVLTTSPQTQGALYTVTVTGVADGVGNPLSNNTAQFRAWVQSPANGVRFEYYFYNEGATLASLLEDPLFPDHPALATNLWAFDSRVIFPDDSHENYGARMSGVFVPPASGNWRFFLRSDDFSRVYLNPNGPAVAGRQLILDGTTCCLDWNGYQSAAFSLVAGQPYYIEMLYKEGGGGDYGKVAARLDGTGYPILGTANTAIDPAALNGPAIGYPYAPADAGGPLSLVGPTNLTLQANHPATFTVTASNPSGLPMFYQWRRNGVNIAGATRPSYSFVATAADNNARFTVQVTKIGSVVVSSEATLAVTSDTDVPAVAAVRGSEYLNTVIVSFAELMGAQDPASYTVPGFTTTGAVLDSTGTNVTVTLNNPLTPGQTYNLTVQNVQDSVGTVLTSATVPFRAFVFSRGLLRYDYFGGLSLSDNNLDNWVLFDPRFPNSPDWTAFLTAFDSRTIFPDDLHNGYGAHVSGLFVPPSSGKYAFFLRGDDSSRFFMNTNTMGPDPIDATMATPMLEAVCCPGFSAAGATNGPMVAGQMYYVTALQKEGGGGDYVQVAAKLEGDPASADGLSPIAGQLLGILADPVGASVTITQQPASAVGVYVGAHLNADFSASDGDFMAVNYGVPAGPWSYNGAAGSWTNFGPSGCGGPYGSGLRTPVLTIMSNDAVVLTFAHRHSFEYDSSANYDGGQVRLSVNGGPFATVPTASFSANGYGGTIGGSIVGTITGTPGWINAAFVRESTGYTNRTFLTSVATLGSFNPGDTIQLEFVASWDECSEGTEPNWEIKSVQVAGGRAVLSTVVSLTVGAESTYRGLPNPYMAYFWQRDTGGGFADIFRPNSATYAFYAGLADSGARFRCIVSGPGASATSGVATVTVTLPLAIARTAPNALTLSWPLPPSPLPVTTFVLEKTPTLVPASWTTVPTNTYQTTATTVYTTVTPADSSVFYRLRRN